MGSSSLGSISAALSCLVYPPRKELRGRSAGSFPDQRLVIESMANYVYIFSLSFATAYLLLIFGYRLLLLLSFSRCRQNLDPPSGPPLLDPLLDPSIFSVKKKEEIIKLYTIRVLHTYSHRFFRTLVSFDSAFSSKGSIPLHATHFQILV